MNKDTNFSGHSFGVYVKDWYEAGYRATSLHLTEEIGESIASGTINMEAAGTKEMTEEQKRLREATSEGILYLYRNNSSGVYESLEYEIPFFIVSTTYERSDVSISFVCCKNGKEFYNNKQEYVYNSVTDAINELYTGKKDIRIDPDSSVDSLELHLNHETPYVALKKFLYSYKKDTIFSFGLEGLIIRSVKSKESSNSWGEDVKTFVIGTDFHLTSPHNFEYGKEMHEDSFNPWVKEEGGSEEKLSEGRSDEDYTDRQAKNLRTIIKNQLYTITRTGYDVMNENYIRNMRYVPFGGSFRDTIEVIGNVMPAARIGDIVNIEVVNPNENKKIDTPFKTYMIVSNEIGITYEGKRKARKQNRPCWWKMKLICLQDYVNSDNQDEEKSVDVQDITDEAL